MANQFRIPNNDTVFNVNQSIWMDSDVDAFVNAFMGQGVLTGCVVSAQVSPGMFVDISAGTARIGGTVYTISGASPAITAAHVTLPRIDLVVAKTNSTFAVIPGTPAASPASPELPDSSVGLALIYVPAAAQKIFSDYITSKRIVLPTFNNIITGNLEVTGNFKVDQNVVGDLTFTDNLYDIGKSGATRPRDLFLSRNLVVGGTTVHTGTTTLTGNIVSDLLFTDATYDVGKSGATRPRDGFFSRNMIVGGTLTSGLINGQTISSTANFTGTLTTAGMLAVNGFGVSTIGAGGTGNNNLQLRLNAGSGASTNYSLVSFARNSLDKTLIGIAGSANGIASGTITDDTVIQSSQSLFLQGTAIRFYTNGSEVGRIHTSGGFSWGSTTDPGATNVRVTGTSTFIGDTKLGSTNITDSVGTPTIASGFNVAPSITGRDYAFAITCGVGGQNGGRVTFGHTFNNPPICMVTSDTNTVPYTAAATTTYVDITLTSGTLSTGAVIYVICRGY